MLRKQKEKEKMEEMNQCIRRSVRGNEEFSSGINLGSFIHVQLIYCIKASNIRCQPSSYVKINKR